MSPAFSSDTLENFERLLSERIGLRCDDGSRDRVREALDRRVRRTGAAPPSYLAQLAGSPTSDAEWRALAQELSIGESYFFRGMDHFRALAETVLPERMRERADSRRLRILSAGCSSGEEPYTVAILLRELIPELSSWQIEVTGIDVSGALLAKAERGIYTQWSLRDVEPRVITTYFRDLGKNAYELDPRIRSMVRFEERNLLGPEQEWPAGSYDVIFCRNVLIYFTTDAILSVLERFEHALAPGGYLFLGHSESLRGLSRRFHLCQSHETFYYQLRDQALPEEPELRALWDQPSFESTAPVLAPPEADDTSWFDAIQRSADRVAQLASGAPPAVAVATVEAPDRSTQQIAERAMVLFRQERYAEVADLIREQAAPSLDTDTLLLLGAALTNRGMAAEAEQVCRRILAADELNAEAAYLLALCREHASDLAGAVREAQLAAYLDPLFAMPHLLMGRLARRRGDLALAERELSRALDLFAREDSLRTLLFGGGFGREALTQLCRAELKSCRSRA